MIIVTCIPAPGFDVYRCGWREEVQNGKKVRIGFCWPSGPTELPDDALTEEQIAMLENDPAERIKVRRIPGVAPGGKGGSQKLAKGSTEAKEAKEAPKDEGSDP